MKKPKLLSPKIDVVFQALFGEVGSEEITKYFLEAILKEKITEIDLSKNPILRRNKLNDKLGILDVIVEINNKESCNIEMQVGKKYNIIERLLYYWAKVYSRNIKNGENYNNLKRTIVILIADFELSELKSFEYFTQWKIIETKDRTFILTELLEIDIIELPKIYREKNKNTNELLKWLNFLENPESKEVESYMATNKAIKKAKDKLKTISDDILMQRLADWREDAIREENGIKEMNELKIKEAWNEGNEKGLKTGLKQEKINIAKKMKKENIDIELIVKITGLNKEEIQKL